MTDQEKESWFKTTNVNLYVSKEYYHHHSFEIINTHKDLKDKFIASLSNEIIKLGSGNESKLQLFITVRS